MSPPLDKNKKDILIEQYRRGSEDWRHYDKMLWEIPFSTTTVVGAIIAIIYGGLLTGQNWLITDYVKLALIGVLIVFVTTMFLLARKIRFFQEARTEFLSYLEKEIFEVKIFPVTTNDSKKIVSKRLISYRTVHFQNSLYLGLELLLAYLWFQIICNQPLDLYKSFFVAIIPFLSLILVFLVSSKERKNG